MRLLADENIPKAVVETLRAEGQDVLWARTDCQCWTDLDIVNSAETEGRVILTLDKDFWQIAMQRRVPLIESGVVLFRTHPATQAGLEPLVRVFLASRNDWRGHVSIITPRGVEMMPLRRR